MRSNLCGFSMAVLMASLGCTAQATEGGALRGLNGAPGAELVTPQFPGWYGQVWFQHYRANKSRDEQGRSPALTTEDTIIGPLDIERRSKVQATVAVVRANWLSEMRWGEGKFGLSFSLPLAEVDQDVRLAARFPSSISEGVRGVVNERLDLVAKRASGMRRGVGDAEVMSYFDWQTDVYRYAFGFGVVAPTGDYDADRDFNVGAGKFWTLRPMALVGYSFDNGISMGVRATYSINTKNKDNDNRSGQYLAADGSVHYSLNDFWRVGAQGFLNLQTTEDRCADPDESRCGKVRVAGFGPVVTYTTESGNLTLDFKVLREFGVRRRPEGTLVWLRVNFRLDQ